MSNRLESLNSNKPGGSKPSLKFRPKAVERKAKAERDATVVKTEEPERTSMRSRGSTRGGRGRGGRQMYAGTHVVSSGLFASGTVAVSGESSSNRSLGTTPTSDSVPRFKLKEQESKTSKSVSSSSHESDDEDFTRIDMNKEYKFAEEETALFPIRPARDDLETHTVKFEREESPVKVEPDFVRESTIDSENIETELQQILNTKSDLESKLAQPVDLLNLEESEKITNDHKRILQTINENFESNNENFTIIQLPKILPQYELPVIKVKTEEPSGSEQIKVEEDVEINGDAKEPVTKVDSAPTSLNGQIGHLNIHKSGKITINLGNDINLDVTEGVSTHFLQELVSLHLTAPVQDEEEMANEDGEKLGGRITKVGEAYGKLVATPSI